MRILFLPLLAILLQACVSTHADRRAPAGKVVEFTLNGQDADAYYKRLIYKTVEMTDSNLPWYRTLSTTWPYLEIDQDLVAMADLYLKEDGTYVFKYVEGRISGPGSAYSVNKKEISGTWKLDGIQLVLNGLGVATGIQLGTVDASGKAVLVDGISLNYDRNIITTGLKGKVSNLQLGFSSAGIKD